MADAAKSKQSSQKEKKPNRNSNKLNKNVNGRGVKSQKNIARTASAMAPRSGFIKTTTLTTVRTRKGKRPKNVKGLTNKTKIKIIKISKRWWRCWAQSSKKQNAGRNANVTKSIVVQTIGKLSRNLGSDESHLYTQVVNKLSNDDNLTYVTDYRSNVDCLTNNLFVYNEKSFPARVRKNVREQIQFSPEVVGVLLPDVSESHNNKKNSTNDKAIVRILLDSGASANTIRARHVKNYFKKTLKIPVTWETTNGSFMTWGMVTERIRFLEFNKSATVKQTYHVCNQKIPL